MRRLLLWGLLGASLLWAAVLVDGLALAYAPASVICHQRPDRSFWIGGHPMPVCARCTGLYLAAPLGLAFVMWRGVRREIASVDRTYSWWRLAVIVAAMPTLASLAIEWIGGPSSNASRAAAAVPLGMAVAGLIGAVVRGDFAETGA